MGLHIFTNNRSALLLFGLMIVAISTEYALANSVLEINFCDETDSQPVSFADRLDAENEIIRHRIAVKERVVAELIEKRITLAAAAQEFLRLDRDLPVRSVSIRQDGENDLERSARSVISYATAREDDIATRAKLLEVLQTELKEIISHEDCECYSD